MKNNYLAIFPNGESKLFGWEDVKYPAEKVKDAIAIIEIETYPGHPKWSNDVYLKTYYRAGRIDLFSDQDGRK